MRCRQVLSFLDELLLDRLPTERLAKLDAHLKACAPCREALEEQRRAHALLVGAWEPRVAPEGMLRAVKAQVEASPRRASLLPLRPAYGLATACVLALMALSSGFLGRQLAPAPGHGGGAPLSIAARDQAKPASGPEVARVGGREALKPIPAPSPAPSHIASLPDGSRAEPSGEEPSRVSRRPTRHVSTRRSGAARRQRRLHAAPTMLASLRGDELASAARVAGAGGLEGVPVAKAASGAKPLVLAMLPHDPLASPAEGLGQSRVENTLVRCVDPVTGKVSEVSSSRTIDASNQVRSISLNFSNTAEPEGGLTQ